MTLTVSRSKWCSKNLIATVRGTRRLPSACFFASWWAHWLHSTPAFQWISSRTTSATSASGRQGATTPRPQLRAAPAVEHARQPPPGPTPQLRRGVSAAAKPGAQNGKTFGAHFVSAKNVARCLAARRRISPKLSVLTGCWLYDHRCRGRSAISFAQSSYQAIALGAGRFAVL